MARLQVTAVHSGQHRPKRVGRVDKRRHAGRAGEDFSPRYKNNFSVACFVPHHSVVVAEPLEGALCGEKAEVQVEVASCEKRQLVSRRLSKHFKPLRDAVQPRLRNLFTQF